MSNCKGCKRELTLEEPIQWGYCMGAACQVQRELEEKGEVRGEFAEPQPARAPRPFGFLLEHWSRKPTTTLPRDSAERKSIPVYSGVVKYAPAALVCVAVVSRIGNDKHNPGQPLHHARGKSNDHQDCSLRHMIDCADEPSELEHAACEAWRALIKLQELCEKHGAPMAPGARK